MSTVTGPQSNGRTAPAGPALLELRGVTAGYGRTTVLRGVDLSVPPGAVVALLGPNGAGKTTLMRVAAGLVGVSSGHVLLGGEDVTRARPHQRVKQGLCLIPEGRGIFPNLSVRENLTLQVPPWRQEDGFEPALRAFPVLEERLSRMAGSLSGGQQQMLALSRSFLAHPNVVLLDEVSMGLAPRIIDEIFEALVNLSHTGVALLLVEQYVTRALELADTAYIMNRGQVVYAGAASELQGEEVFERYLGIEVG